jgi:hypothetical protein
MAIANNLEFIATPQHLTVLTNHEWRVLSPRLAFMKIYEAPVGRQLKIYGNVANVVSDCVNSTDAATLQQSIRNSCFAVQAQITVQTCLRVG